MKRDSFIIALVLAIALSPGPRISSWQSWAGLLILSSNGTSCPPGSVEATDLVDRTLVTTSIAAANAGTTGGNDSITPSGTNSMPTFTGNSFNGVITHTHSVNVTDPGHTHGQTVNSATNGGLSGYTPDASTNTPAASGYSTASATTGITASATAPGGAVASITPTGTVSAPTFTGVQFDNRSAFVRVIVCRVN